MSIKSLHSLCNALKPIFVKIKSSILNNKSPQDCKVGITWSCSFLFKNYNKYIPILFLLLTRNGFRQRIYKWDTRRFGLKPIQAEADRLSFHLAHSPFLSIRPHIIRLTLYISSSRARI